ncbi:MAG: hypothetical protein L0211_03120 [Planctomycetaceae bacterium]|nr:hypothetical protein [Planctomycetaceae bacterium]
MIQPQGDPPADRTSSNSIFFEFTDVAIPLPPGIRSRHRSSGQSDTSTEDTPDPNDIRRREQRFRQISDEDLLSLWRACDGDQPLRDAVTNEARRRAAGQPHDAISKAIKEILGG